MQTISEKVVAALPIPATGNKVYYFSGATLQGKKAPSGFGVRVTASGTKAFVLFHRTDRKKYLETLGRWDENPQGGSLTVREAIVRADRLAKEINSGRREDPRPARTRGLQDRDKPAKMDVSGLIDAFIQRYAEGRLRSAGMIKAQLERLVKPRIGKVGIYDLKRSQVSKLLDEIADEHGPRMADLALAYTRKAFHWYEINGHDDDFKSPIVRGMARQKPSERERERVLADDEIRDLWSALETVSGVPACFGPYVRTLFLTATRRSETAEMVVAEIAGDIWTIPASRYKTKRDHVIPLSKEARSAIGKLGKSGFVFSSDGGATAINGWSKTKVALDAEIARIREAAGRKPMEPWTFHDLRRTARSLMSRAGVPADHAERCLGHVIPGIRGTYDRHSFLDEKSEAFTKLAAMLDSILRGA